MLRKAGDAWRLRLGVELEQLAVDGCITKAPRNGQIALPQPGRPSQGHCCIEPEGVGEAQSSGGSPHPKGAKKDSNHSIVVMSGRV
jgi:hypothetical protein